MDALVWVMWAVRVLAALLGVVLVFLGLQVLVIFGILGLFLSTAEGLVPVLQGTAIGLGVVAAGGWLLFGAVLKFPLARRALVRIGVIGN